MGKGEAPSRTRSMRQTIKRQFEVREEHVAPVYKICLFISNSVAFIISANLVAIGIYSRSISQNFLDLSGFTTDPSVLLILVGSFFTVVSFLGAVGSLRENVPMLKAFHYILIALLLIELISGLLVYFLQAKVKEVAIETTVRAISQYQTTNRATALDDALREVQLRFDCCGASHPSDWRQHSRYFACTREAFTDVISSCGVPSSCCRNKMDATTNAQCGYKVFAYPNMTSAEQAMYPRIAQRSTLIFTGGCVEAVFNWIVNNYVVLGSLAGVVVFIQLIGIEFSRRLIDQIWYIQTQL